jgi:hypothetical protein
MTPAMEALREIAQLDAIVTEAKNVLEELLTDGSQLTLAEGQIMSHVMDVQGRPFTWRTQLTKLLRNRRGINAAAQPWRTRARGITPEDVPDYLSPQSLAALRKHADALAKAVKTVQRSRKRQYPALQERTKALIEGTTDTAEAQAS